MAGKILLPGLSVLERVVARVRLRSASHLHRRLAEGIDAEARLRLDRLVAVPEGERQSPLDRLRDGPFIQSGPEISRSLLRLGEVQSFVQELPKIDRIPPGKITALWKFASAARVQAVARLPEERRTATLLAFIHTLEASAADDVIDVFDAVSTAMFSEAEAAAKRLGWAHCAILTMPR